MTTTSAPRTGMRPRGPLSEALLTRLGSSPAPAPELAELAQAAVTGGESVLVNEDVQAALTVAYELHYRGLPGVDDRWEWHPDVGAMTAVAEEAFERDVRAAVAERLPAQPVKPEEVPRVLAELTDTDDGPSMSRYVARRATREQVAEFLVHRSVYHLKEADPHTWAIPRLAGRIKAALVEIQADEYGGGDPERMHAVLFARSMRHFGLDDAYGAYLDAVPAVTLAWANAMTFFGLHRRLRGAAVGHLAALEMTSSIPNRRYGNGLRRLGFDQDATWFFDEHVEADAVHEQIAAHDLAGRLALTEPVVVPDILLGAAAALVLDGRVNGQLLRCWSEGRSSLREDRHAGRSDGRFHWPRQQISRVPSTAAVHTRR